MFARAYGYLRYRFYFYLYLRFYYRYLMVQKNVFLIKYVLLSSMHYLHNTPSNISIEKGNIIE